MAPEAHSPVDSAPSRSYRRSGPGDKISCKVIDQALHHWYAQQQEVAMEAQYAAPEDGIASERKAWRSLRRAAAKRRLSRP